MDRPSRRPDSIEPDVPTDSHDQTAVDATGSELTELRSARPDHPVDNAADPAAVEDERIRDDDGTSEIAERTHDTTSATGAPDSTEVASERGRDAEPTAIARADNVPGPARDLSTHLPAKLREQMRQDPTFTRLGWGANEPTTRPSEHAKPESPRGSGEVENAKVDEEGTSRDEVEKSADEVRFSDDSDQSRRFSIDAEIEGQPLRARFDRWDPERLAMPRPPKPDVSGSEDTRTDEQAETADRRAEDLRNGVAYIAAHQESRPWLAPAADCEPMVQTVYASIDLSSGHGHIRHGAMGSDEMQARRVAFNEDPAQVDPDKRAAGVDGLDDQKQHYCGKDSTRVNDAIALAAIYVMAAEHPDVRAVLDLPFDNNVQPRDIVVPISDLLGPNGHEFCSGFTLKGWPEAKHARKEWLEAQRSGGDLSDLPAPEVERIPTFEGGDIKIVFKRNPETRSYGIYTLFPRPFEE